MQAFAETETVPGGLGPVFTENACVVCHGAGGAGGSGLRTVTRFGRILNGQYDNMVAFGGPMVQDRGIGKFNGVNFVGEVVPPQATIVARRRTVPLFGLGLVDAVPDAAFVAIAQQEAEMSPATAGQVSQIIDVNSSVARVGKFGWKAQHVSLFDFSGDAYANELGVTTPLFPYENCPQGNCALLAADPAKTNPNDATNSDIQEFADFVTFLAPAPRGPANPTVQAGANIFASIGCANCHRPTLQTGPSPSATLNEVVFAPYSDFLLHDMGSLGDGIVQGDAGPTQMRTAPLWGLRFEPSYLHDGRAQSVDSAIQMHAGQGLAASRAYQGLTSTQKNQLLAFLNSL